MHDPIEHPLFKLEQNGTLVTREKLDFEIDENHTITVRVFDEYNATYDKEFLVSVTNIVEDLDGDGIENHYDTDDDNDSIADELDPDDDNDGFSDADEFAYGSDPLDPNSVANAAPNFLELNGTTILENQPIDTKVGQLIGNDPDTNATLSFSLVDGNGSDDNSLFELDDNASVRTTTIFDYETDEHNYSIRVSVADEHNFSIERSFTINLLNVVEDNDQDGVEDPYDPDDDNDGYSDNEELAYGSDPKDANSVANTAPSSITLSHNQISENQPLETIVGQLSAEDVDLTDSHVFSLIEVNGSRLNNDFFHIDENGTLRANTKLDFEYHGQELAIRVQVNDGHHIFPTKSKGKRFLINLLDQNEPPSDLNPTTPLQVMENQPAGTLVGQFTAKDPDMQSTLTYKISNAYVNKFPLRLDANGTLWTTAPLDYEANASLTIKVKVEDQHGAWIKQDFTVKVLNKVEDLDKGTGSRITMTWTTITMVTLTLRKLPMVPIPEMKAR